MNLSETAYRPARPRAAGEERARTFPGIDRCDSVVWFGNTDWWYHNRGHSAARMAVRIAAKVPTLWINSIGMRMPVPGKTEVAWKRYRRKLASLLRGLRRDEASGMWVYTPLFVPRYTARAVEVNGALLAWQVRVLCRRLGMKYPSAGISMPTMIPALERLPWVQAVFERCDDFTTMPGVDVPLVAALEQRLLARCDHVAYVSEELFARERDQTANPQLLGHGVDFAQLSTARIAPRDRAVAPEPIRSLAGSIVGFFGGMDDYRMDAELMIKIARHIHPATLLLVGPEQMDLARVKAEPNVRHVGQVPPDQLADYAAHFDVGVIPFLRNEFNRRCNPVKLKEYLALGFPIVATDLPAYTPYAELVHTAETHEEFLSALNRALAERDPAREQKRRAAVAGDDWDKVAERMARMLGVP
jgi:glycosyltransferase involved in cell wall biosynthesis